jgi:hypothetical protein
MEQEGVMNGKIYEEATWYDIERNKMQLKRDGEHYVADAMLFRENANLRQENESLKKENDRLRELIRTVWLAGDFRSFLGVEEIKERMRELRIEVSDVPDDPPTSDAVRRVLVRLMDKLGGDSDDRGTTVHPKHNR